MAATNQNSLEQVESSSSPSPDLPEHLVEEQILPRLSPEFLVRSKRVCKSWRAIIHDPAIVAEQLRRARASVSASPAFSILRCEDGRSELKYALLDMGSGSSSSSSTNGEDDEIFFARTEEFNVERFPGQEAKYFSSALHCDGLICIHLFKFDVMLCNPALRESKLVPASTVLEDHEALEPYVEVIGFGYDPIDEDYKIVRVWSPPITEIYSNRSEAWREIETGAADLVGFWAPKENSMELHHKGVCYWFFQRSDNSGERVIVCFDLHAEKYRRIELPRRRCDLESSALSVWKDSVVLFSGFEEERWMRSIEIWVMNGDDDDNKSCSWTKHLSIGPLHGSFVPLSFWQQPGGGGDGDGVELLMQREGGRRGLVSYNLRSGKLRRLTIQGMSRIVHCVSYVKTLVSVNRQR